jgi:hypothetical protein
MRGEALRALEGADWIIHAGDIGKPEVLRALARIAPVHAVRGNVDTQAWAQQLPPTATVEAGHSHTAVRETRHGVLYLNPGSAGPRPFRLPASVARTPVLHRPGQMLRRRRLGLIQISDRAVATAGTSTCSGTRASHRRSNRNGTRAETCPPACGREARIKRRDSSIR